MKFRISKEIPQNENFHPIENGWNLINEPKTLNKYTFSSVPISLIIAYIIKIIALSYGININITFRSLFYLLILFVVHELIHAISLMGALKSDVITFGIIPKNLTFYTYYDDELSKSQLLFSLSLPFLVITVLPVIMLCLLGIGNSFIIELSILNSLVSSIDILQFIIILFKTPNNCRIRSKGIKNYWI